MAKRDERVPVTVLTGFLGSGKTTLLQRLLDHASGAGVAVLINELGEIALDHLFVQTITETAVVMKNGCICCSIRDDLQQGIRELFDGLYQGSIPPFKRILIETTGLADPTPIAQTLSGDPMLLRQTRLANIITTVDAIFGAEQLSEHEENLRQAALADRIVLTKTDIARPEQVEATLRRVRAINPLAMVIDAKAEQDLWSLLLDIDPFDARTKSADARAWLAQAAELSPAHAHGEEAGGENAGKGEHSETAAHEHGAEPGAQAYHRAWHGDANAVATFALRTEEPINWTAFAIWLSALVHKHGKKILRIKGLLNVPGAKGAVVLNTVQSHITPPVHLEQWPDEDRASRLVFIVQGVDPALVRRSMEVFLSLADKKA